VDGKWNKDDTVGGPAPALDDNMCRDFSHTHAYELLFIGWFVATVMARGTGEGAWHGTAVREMTGMDRDDVTVMWYNGIIGVFFAFFWVDFEIYYNNMVKLFYKWSESPFINGRNST
jgi:hypothetical protein